MRRYTTSAFLLKIYQKPFSTKLREIYLVLQISAGALVDLAQHKPEAVVDAGAICHLVHGLENQDPKLKVRKYAIFIFLPLSLFPFHFHFISNCMANVVRTLVNAICR